MRPKQDQSSTTFWSHVDKSGECWIWKAARHSRGYGSFRFRGKQTTAHRAAFQIESPAVSVEGMDICHTCDNRLCVRPSHLFVGTRQDNVDDMVKKGRALNGHKHIKAKLTPEQVAAIKIDNRTNKVVGTSYGVDAAVVSRIKNGKAYVTQ